MQVHQYHKDTFTEPQQHLPHQEVDETEINWYVEHQDICQVNQDQPYHQKDGLDAQEHVNCQI